MTDNSFKIDANNSTLGIGQMIFPIGSIYFYQRDKPRLLYSPKDDITGIEVARLIPLFVTAINSSGFNYYDFWGYINEHKLMRHFIETN